MIRARGYNWLQTGWALCPEPTCDISIRYCLLASPPCQSGQEVDLKTGLARRRSWRNRNLDAVSADLVGGVCFAALPP